MDIRIRTKVDMAIKLDKELKEKKKELDGIKAELQAAALVEMENKNLKYKQIFGSMGSCDVMYKEKFEIDNYPLLRELLGEILDTKVVKKEEIKFDIDSRFKEALIALVKGEYAPYSIVEMLKGFGLDDKKAKMVERKLKGNYIRDKQVLESVGLTGDLEEELDAIREAKNLELINRYFDTREISLKKLWKAIYLEESLSIGLTYDKAE